MDSFQHTCWTYYRTKENISDLDGSDHGIVRYHLLWRFRYRNLWCTQTVTRSLWPCISLEKWRKKKGSRNGLGFIASLRV